jgi:hypothetical protein
MNISEERIREDLSDLLNECLESYNQENTFEIVSVDMKNKKVLIEFDFVIVEDDDYIGFAGY